MARPEEYETRIKRLDWGGLGQLWQAVEKGDTPGWEAGKAFEYLVLRAFELDGAQVRYPYEVELHGERVEQIDGAVHAAGLRALVESKDLGENVAIGPIAKLRNQLLRRPGGTLGLLFSSKGFTEPARLLAHFLSPQVILLWAGAEIAYALQDKKVCSSLEWKYRRCIEEGIPDANIRGSRIP
jgi:hypothetical protein